MLRVLLLPIIFLFFSIIVVAQAYDLERSSRKELLDAIEKIQQESIYLVNTSRSNNEKALEKYREALKIVKAIESRFSEERFRTLAVKSEVYSELGMTFSALGQHENSEKAYRYCYHLRKRLYKEDSEQVMLTSLNLASALIDTKKLNEAEELMDVFFDWIKTRLESPVDGDIIGYMNVSARLQYALGTEESRALGRKFYNMADDIRTISRANLNQFDKDIYSYTSRRDSVSKICPFDKAYLPQLKRISEIWTELGMNEFARLINLRIDQLEGRRFSFN